MKVSGLLSLFSPEIVGAADSKDGARFFSEISADAAAPMTRDSPGHPTLKG